MSLSAYQSIKIFGPPPGAAGVSVIEQVSTNVLTDPTYGSVMLFGVMKRGPVGVSIPISSKQQYQQLFGDPNDPTWHLYEDASHLMPDAIEGFFGTSSGAGQVLAVRLELEDAREASAILKNRMGGDALRVKAANVGRWGGYANKISSSTVVVATSRTFTLVAPNVKSNEFVGATVEFSSGTGRRYAIISNTVAAPESGEVIFVIGPQYDLVADGISGPISVDGLASYSRSRPLTGTVQFPMQVNLTGTCTVNDRVVIGTGTVFLQQLKVGSNIYSNGEARRIESITSNTTLTVVEPFSSNGTALTLQRDNLKVIGASTEFLSELSPGDLIYHNYQGKEYSREIASIESDGELTLVSGFDFAILSGASIYADNLWVEGSEDSNYSEDLLVGDRIIDPSRRGKNVTVVEIDAETLPHRFKIDKQFSFDFTDAQLVKQSQSAVISLEPQKNIGLAVEVGQGVRFPETHFSMRVFFNGTQVMFVPDASLEPGDPLYVDRSINLSNIAYRTASESYSTWIQVESLWNGEYTTSAKNDVRPCNGTGTILALSPQRLYTVGEFDYESTIGRSFFPNPYKYPRQSLRVRAVQAPLKLEGTVSSSGVQVTGTGTVFRSILKPGDYLYDPVDSTARKVRLVLSDTELLLESVFPKDLPAGTKTFRVGYLSVDRGVDLTKQAKVGDRFLVSFPEFLKEGYDGDAANLLPYHFTRYFDVDTNFPERSVYGKNLGLVRIACPGISDEVVQKAGIQYASQKAFEYRAEIPSYINSAPVAESFISQNLEKNDYMSVLFPSYGYVSNPKGTGDRFISLTGDVMGLESYKASLAQGYHVPAAGLDARLARVIKLPFTPNPDDEGIINLAGIQPIKLLGGAFTIFGARTPSASDLYKFLHIRRIQSNYIRIFIEAQPLLQSLFQPNQPELAYQIIMVLENLARREYKKGVYTRYLNFEQAVRIQNSPPGSESISNSFGNDTDVVISIINGNLTVYYSYTPTGILEKMRIFVNPDTLISSFGDSVN